MLKIKHLLSKLLIFKISLVWPVDSDRNDFSIIRFTEYYTQYRQ